MICIFFNENVFEHGWQLLSFPMCTLACTVNTFSVPPDLKLQRHLGSSKKLEIELRPMEYQLYDYGQTYKDRPGDVRCGYLEGTHCVMDINARDCCIPKTMLGFLHNDFYLKRLKEMKVDRPRCVTNVDDVILKPPIHGIDKILCVGLNYNDHCEQHKLKPPQEPMVFGKFSSTIIGPGDSIKIRTDVTEKVDWEVELCVVMGKEASFVRADEAYNYVFGCTIAQDISARDWQKEKNAGQFLLGKSMDTFCPIGPCIVTLDEIGDPQNLNIGCNLNGVYKQKSNTSQMIFKIPEIIERLSSVMTLVPGDIILTGTPGGVGMYASPPELLKPGDVLRSEIEKIGVLETRVEKYCKPQKL